jgi:hypothetical protein
MGGIRVINLFGYRATNPRELETCEDPVGFADGYLETYHGTGPDLNIAAWGDGGLVKGRSRVRFAEALSILCYDYATKLYCLGLTKAGQPRHPLRLPYDVHPSLWVDGRAGFLSRLNG